MHDKIVRILKRDGVSDESRLEDLLRLFEPPPTQTREADPALVQLVEEWLGRSIDDRRAIIPITFEKTPIYMLVETLRTIPVAEATVSCNLASLLAIQLAQVAREAGYHDALVARIS